MASKDNTANTKQVEKKSTDNKGNASGGGQKNGPSPKRRRSRSPNRGTQQGGNKRGKRSGSPRPRWSGNTPAGSEHKLFVGNLQKGTKPEELKEFIAGLVRKGARVNDVISGCTMKNKFAFLEFKTKRDMNNALKRNGVEFKGCRLTINNAFSKDVGQAAPPVIDPWSALSALSSSPFTLCVWNVPYGVSGDELMAFFNRLMMFTGLVQTLDYPVLQCYPAPNEECYVVVVRSVSDAAQLMLFNGINYLGSSLVITVADDGAPPPGFAQNAVEANMTSFSERLHRIVYVENIFPGAGGEEMVKLFNKEMHLSGLAQAPGEPIIGYEFDPQKCVALLEFRCSAEARGAVALDGISYMGRSLKIGWLTEFQQSGQVENSGNVGSSMPGFGGARNQLMENADVWSMDDRELHSALERERWGALAERFQMEDPRTANLTLSHRVPRNLCKLYVGMNMIPGDRTQLEQGLLMFINKRMKAAGLQLAYGDPVISCILKDSFGFLEFRSVEETTNALILDGINFSGRSLAIKRPSNYPSPKGKEDPVITRAERTVHVFPSGVTTEYHVAQIVYHEMLRRSLTQSPGDPVIACVKKDRGTYFSVLLRYKEEAIAALTLDNTAVGDFVLRVKPADDQLQGKKGQKPIPENRAPKDEKQETIRGPMKPACRVFVSNFPTGISEGELKDFFNKLMIQTGLAEKPGNCVDRCEIIPDTNFAYLEFRSASEANQALILDDLSFRGQKLRIKRPVDSKAADDAAKTKDSSPSIAVQDNKITLETEPKRQHIPELAEFSPRNSSPAISSIIDHIEGMTSQVLKRVAEFQEKGYTGGAEFTAAADLLSVNITVSCANGARMTYHPKMGAASATIEIQNPTRRETSQRVSSSYPSSETQKQVRQESNLAKPSMPPPLLSIPVTAPALDNSRNSSSSAVSTSAWDNSRQSSVPTFSNPVWDNSYKSSSATALPTKPVNNTTNFAGGKETNWLIATWNVRGVNSADKQLAIDQTLNSEAVEIAALQETHMAACTFDSKNYKWLLSSDTARSLQGGVGFVVRKDLVPLIVRWNPVSDYLACLQMRTNDVSIAIITVLIPFDGSTTAATTLDRLVSILSVFPANTHIYVVGDFNAQIGANDVMGDERTLVGQYLEHSRSNKNGLLLLRLITETKLFHLSSLLGNNGTLVTRTQGSDSSQVDHILGNCCSSVLRVAAGFIPKVRTDHKIMWAVTSVLPCPKHPSTSQ